MDRHLYRPIARKTEAGPTRERSRAGKGRRGRSPLPRLRCASRPRPLLVGLGGGQCRPRGDAFCRKTKPDGGWACGTVGARASRRRTRPREWAWRGADGPQGLVARTPRSVHLAAFRKRTPARQTVRLGRTPGTLRRTVRLCLHPGPSALSAFVELQGRVSLAHRGRSRLGTGRSFCFDDLPPDRFFSSGLRRDGADSTRTPLRPTASPSCPCSLVFPLVTRALRQQRAGPQQALKPPLNTPSGPGLQSPSRLGSALDLRLLCASRGPREGGAAG